MYNVSPRTFHDLCGNLIAFGGFVIMFCYGVVNLSCVQLLMICMILHHACYCFSVTFMNMYNEQL